MSIGVRKSTSGSGWDVVESNGYARKTLRKFNYRSEARDWLKAFKGGEEPKHDTSVWRNAETPIADNH